MTEWIDVEEINGKFVSDESSEPPMEIGEEFSYSIYQDGVYEKTLCLEVIDIIHDSENDRITYKTKLASKPWF